MNEIFKPDFSKLRYKIVISVFENAHLFEIEKHLESPENYQDVIGTLEITKAGFLEQHRQLVIKAAKKKKKA